MSFLCEQINVVHFLSSYFSYRRHFTNNGLSFVHFSHHQTMDAIEEDIHSAPPKKPKVSGEDNMQHLPSEMHHMIFKMLPPRDLAQFPSKKVPSKKQGSIQKASNTSSNMDKALLSWAVQEFGYVPVSSSSSTDTTGLRKLCSGSLQPYWKYVTTHVKSDIETLKIKGNLKLYHRKLQHQEPSKSSLNIEDQTLSERDMLIKELKDINFLSKKCREKGSKVRAEIAQNTKAYHTLKSSYDSRECLVDSQMKQLNFLNLLSESYTEKISGEKLNQLSADSKALTGYCGELTSNGKVNTKASSMNRLYAECVEVLKAGMTMQFHFLNSSQQYISTSSCIL